jgi:hypothetical protein
MPLFPEEGREKRDEGVDGDPIHGNDEEQENIGRGQLVSEASEREFRALTGLKRCFGIGIRHHGPGCGSAQQTRRGQDQKWALPPFRRSEQGGDDEGPGEDADTEDRRRLSCVMGISRRFYRCFCVGG